VASDLEHHLAFAIRWSGSEPGAAAELAAPALDRATSYAGFRGALTRWKMPARRVAYADAGSHVSLTVAFVPGRRGWNGAMPVSGWTGASEWHDWIVAPPAPAETPAKAATRILLDSLRVHPDRADALLQRLAAQPSSPDSLKPQRALLVDALAEALRERAIPASGNVLFAHPLAVTDPARRRFNVLTPSPSGSAADAFEMTIDGHDWDRSTAINAPGQSGSPESPHFADLAALWSQGKTFTLAFTERAVQAHAEATLTLTPR
jgi:acyl-homoserine lactone acylase PvdQ